VLVKRLDLVGRRLVLANEAVLAILATPPLDTVVKPLFDDGRRAAKTAFFFSYWKDTP
jgi:hypothetical protein